MERTTIDYGIDLGTTNSTIAVINGTDAEPIPNSLGSVITPSAVHIDKRGNLFVGRDAKMRALINDPDNADLEFKLRMGLGRDGAKQFKNSGRVMTPEELSAEVLKQLKYDVQTFKGETVKTAVITVPAAFELPMTNATQKAAELAGFTLCPLLLEPVAASLAYGFQSEAENVYWLVYDFGGGTFDSAIMRVRDGRIQVVYHEGDNLLGGKLLDWDLATQRLAPTLASQHNLLDFRRHNPRWAEAFGKLKYHAEEAKIHVCRTRTPYEIWIENICRDDDGRPVDFCQTVTPADIEQISCPYIERSLRLCRNILQKTSLKGSDMNRIIMVGGSSLNPWVREAVQAELGAQLEFSIDPVTVVARGAAIYASTQKIPDDKTVALKKGVWRIQIEHEPVGDANDPDIGGKLIPPAGENPHGYTVEFVDTKTQWHSGKIRLGAEGIFMTQLFADAKRRCEFDIHFLDPTGTKIETSPTRVVYTIGKVPENPPAPHSIGVGLANGEVAVFVKKGAQLPTTFFNELRSTVAIRAGRAEDEFRIAVIEGENSRATRNHPVGDWIIRGTDIKRDLPAGSKVEITLTMNESQQVRVHVLFPMLDEDFDIEWDLKMERNSIGELKTEAEEQKKRYADLHEQAKKNKVMKAEVAIMRIENENLVSEIDSLLDATENDHDALLQLDRRNRNLAAAIDDVEDALEWPLLRERAIESRNDADQIVQQYGDIADKNRFRVLDASFEDIVRLGDTDLLRRCADDFDTLWSDIAWKQPAYHVGRFRNLSERVGSMRDPNRADQLISQGNRAINNDDIEGLRAVNNQLNSLLPAEERPAEDKRISTLI